MLDNFIDIFDNFFPKSVKVKVKFKSDQSPWITEDIVKSSKKKQRLYEKFLKNRTLQNEETYKTYKNLFETIKKRSKKKFARKNCRSLKVMGKNMECYERDTWKVHHKILNSSHVKKTFPDDLKIAGYSGI